MPTFESRTKWRDRPAVPGTCDDAAALVRLARRARSRIGDVGWAFREADLRRPREPVHPWGSSFAARL